jgi:uroporphyrinogen-III synthase
MPPVYNGAALALALAEKMSPGEEALLIRSQVSEKGLDRGLKEKAIPFRELAVYETLPAKGGPPALDIIGAGRFDFVLFFSPSAAAVFAAACPAPGVKALCIGAAAAARAEEFGMTAYTAAEATTQGLCRLASDVISRQSPP